MSGEKTEKPTPKKLRDARKKGQVAKSKEIGSAANIISVFVLIWVMSDFYIEHAGRLITMGTVAYTAPFEECLNVVLTGILDEMARMILPLMLVVIVVGLAANFLQIGLLFAFESVKPDLKKLNPASAFKRIFSMKNFMEFLKSIFKIIFISVLLYSVLKAAMPLMFGIPYSDINVVLVVLGTILKKIVTYTSVAFIIVSAADFLFQKHQHIKDLKMTKDEVKREYKEMEGDPQIKGKRKQLHRELLSDNMMNNVRKSSVVVTNPTRIAVAIWYDKEKTKLPVITAMGENLLAKRIIEIAKEENIPIMMNVPLARDLLEQGKIDEYIPSDLIEPVAEVLKWVFKLKQEHGGG